jgi:hypothetical protein
MTACQQTVPTNKENLQKIFDTKDFTVTFYPQEGEEHFMGFRMDYVTYKHEGKTKRETISYDQALLVSNFIKQKLTEHNDEESAASIVVESPQYKVEIKLEDYDQEFEELLKNLKI